MLYREAGQFKTSYQQDAAIFPILQDKIAIGLVVLAAFVVVPLVATPYVFTGILIPFLILSLAALGLNILTGYAGQLSLGTAAFMAVGAFAVVQLHAARSRHPDPAGVRPAAARSRRWWE
jgi:branched-chain amino acid transport system permease protein